MINIRYHVYSLVAVFLALAIGVAAGSTVVQRSVVDNLRSTQGRIEENLDDLEAQNAELQERTAALEGREGALLDEGPGALLAGELSGVPIVLVRAEGMAGEAVDRVRDVLGMANAEIVADVELQAAAADPEVLVAAAAEEAALAAEGDAPEQIQAALGERLGELLVAVEAERPDPLVPLGPPDEERPADGEAAPTTEPPAAEAAVELAELLRRLDDLGLLSFRGPLGDAGVDTGGARVVVLGGETAAWDPVPVLDPMLSAVAAGAPPMAAAADATIDEPPADGEERFGIVDAVRTDGRLRDEVATVDHVAGFAGLSALVLAVAGLGRGEVGHFGVDDGADSLLPSPRS